MDYTIILEGECYKISEVRYKVSEVHCKISEVRCKLLSKILTWCECIGRARVTFAPQNRLLRFAPQMTNQLVWTISEPWGAKIDTSARKRDGAESRP
jgi:hypothetical protein